MADSHRDRYLHRARLRQYYDKTARQRDSARIQDWKLPLRENFLARVQAEGKTRLLEVGAGPGKDSLFFQQHGLRATAADLSPGMAALCAEKGLPAAVMDMAALGFADGSFEAAYAMNSLLHIPKTEFAGVLREVRRVLRPGGLFFCGIYGGQEHEGIFADDPHEPKRFFSFFSDAHLLESVSAVFAVESFEHIALEDDPLHFQALVLRKDAPSLDDPVNNNLPNQGDNHD